MDHVYCKKCGAALEGEILVWRDVPFCDAYCAIDFGLYIAEEIIEEQIDINGYEITIEDYIKETE